MQQTLLQAVQRNFAPHNRNITLHTELRTIACVLEYSGQKTT
jgi:hypothetical protein